MVSSTFRLTAIGPRKEDSDLFRGEGAAGRLFLEFRGAFEANVNDPVLLKETIEAIVVKRPRPTEKEPQHLCLDAGYDNQVSRETVKEHHYQGHNRPARRKGSARKGKKKYPPRRWVVERTFSWLSKCRGLLVRYEKQSKNYLGLLQFACALYWYRRLRAATADSA